MFLESINSPRDLKKLSPEELIGLSAELRQRIIEVVSKNGGHIASSLGAVELIVALHYCLDTPKDKIIFDVGHQAYAHKILTGRNKNFGTLRQYQGISGFPSKDESDFDIFTCGHSSSAVSLASGIVSAREHLPEQERNFKVAAVIGDGSLSGGLCFEGLNNAGHHKKDILVILNTNELSIAPNTGALSVYLNRIISMPIYNRFRDSLDNFAKSRLPKGSRILKIANQFEEGLKGLFIPGMFFEELGFRYFGPVDGHNLNLLVSTLKNLMQIKGPRLLHIVTKKGKGYLPAENDPVKFHGTGSFEVATGAPLTKSTGSTYTELFSRKLVDLAGKNNKIIAITAAMPEGTGLDKFRDSYPERFFDVGIAEPHAVCFAAGLARQGFKPVVAIYSTFLQRAYDQILEDVALQNLGVIFAIDRAGIVGEDGVTHQGIFDISFLKTVPHLVIMAPADGKEMEEMLEFAVSLDKPVAIRYPKEKIPDPKPQIPPRAEHPVSTGTRYEANSPAARDPAKFKFLVRDKIELGKPVLLKEGKDFVLIALGSMVAPSLTALETLEKEGLSGTLINARFVKPLDTGLLESFTRQSSLVFTAEESIIEGGFGSAVAEALNIPVHKIGLPCEFIPHGAREILLDKYGLSAAGIAGKIREVIGKNG